MRPVLNDQSARSADSTIMIVEDDPVTRRVLALLLSGCGYPTEAAASAEEALDLVRDGHVPEVALVDLDLPGMNGLEFISRLEQVKPDTFMVLLTASSLEKLNATRKNQHFIYLRKPSNFQYLLSLIDRNQLHA